MTDLQLAQEAQAGDRDAADQLIRRYASTATQAWTHGFYLPGAATEDLVRAAA